MLPEQSHEIIDISFNLSVGIKPGHQIFDQFVQTVSGNKKPIDCRKCESCGIQGFHFLIQLVAGLQALIDPDLRNLIAQRIHHNRRMVIVMSDHGSDVLFPALVEGQSIIKVGLTAGPHVKGLIHHIHPQFIAGTKHCRSHGMMCHSYRVESRFLQFPNLAELCLIVGRRTQKTTVMMNTSATQVHCLAVYLKTVDSIHLNGSNSECCLIFIKQLPSFTQEPCLALVKRRSLIAPQIDAFQSQPLRYASFFPLKQREGN